MKISMDDVVVSLLEQLQQDVRAAKRNGDDSEMDRCRDQALILVKALEQGTPSTGLKERIERIVEDAELLHTLTDHARTATFREIYPVLY
ncbi:hypothetical protein HZA85_02535 [Candidatus Uhrbacteria bacterium]|nr:hypothetical protein [Candidatus Uhrbacteria bacterium]